MKWEPLFTPGLIFLDYVHTGCGLYMGYGAKQTTSRAQLISASSDPASLAPSHAVLACHVFFINLGRGRSAEALPIWYEIVGTTSKRRLVAGAHSAGGAQKCTVFVAEDQTACVARRRHRGASSPRPLPQPHGCSGRENWTTRAGVEFRSIFENKRPLS